MENENTTGSIEPPFKFMENSDVKEKFADLNIELLRGRHIQKATIITSINYLINIMINSNIIMTISTALDWKENLKIVSHFIT